MLDSMETPHLTSRPFSLPRLCGFAAQCWNIHRRSARRESRHPSPAPCTLAMENLDKLSATGLPVFDLNQEHLDQNDWWDDPTHAAAPPVRHGARTGTHRACVLVRGTQARRFGRIANDAIGIPLRPAGLSFAAGLPLRCGRRRAG